MSISNFSSDKPAAPKGYVLEKQLGEGATSRVWLGRHIQLQKMVAIKIISKQYLQEPGKKQKLITETQIHKMIRHRHIAQLFGVTNNFLNHYLIMEYIPNDSLLEKVKLVSHFSEPEAIRYFIQVLSAVEYLHHVVHVIHRDLKLENIMVDQEFKVKLIDFGFAENFNPNRNETFKAACGSPRYISPEMFSGNPYTKSTDIWSLGVILFVLVVGKFPFEGESMAILSHNIQTKEPVFPSHVSNPMKELIMGLLTKDPNERITIEKIYEAAIIKRELGKHPDLVESEIVEIEDPVNDENILTKSEKQCIIDELVQSSSSPLGSASGYLKRNASLGLNELRMNDDSSPLSSTSSGMNSSMSITDKLVASGRFRLKAKTGDASQDLPTKAKTPQVSKIKLRPRRKSHFPESPLKPA